MRRLLTRFGALAACALMIAGCGSGYQKAGDRWVFVTIDEGRGRVEHPLEGADPATFEILVQGVYARDAKHVYREANSVAGADAPTFTVIEKGLWAKDRSHVWVEYVLVPDADPASFRTLQFPYSRDASHVFCGSVTMPIADLSHFEVISGSRDTQTIYSGDALAHDGLNFVPGVDRDHPALIGAGRARDGKVHYFGPVPLASSDYASFKAFNDYYAKDRTHVFYKYQLMSGADPETFKADGEFGEDKGHLYVGASVTKTR